MPRIRPASDLVTATWSSTPAGQFWSAIDDTVMNDSDYVTSPVVVSKISPPLIMTLDAPIPTIGACEVILRAKSSVVDGGRICVTLLDSNNVVTSSPGWITIMNKGTFADYRVTIMNRTVATRVKVEVDDTTPDIADITNPPLKLYVSATAVSANPINPPIVVYVSATAVSATPVNPPIIVKV